MENKRRNCLLLFALGDALGSPAGKHSYRKLKKKYGDLGVEKLYFRKEKGAIWSDLTKAQIFTVEALLRYRSRCVHNRKADLLKMIYLAYLRGLYTQGYPKTYDYNYVYDGCLLEAEALYDHRGFSTAEGRLLLSREVALQFKASGNSDAEGSLVPRAMGVGLCLEGKEAYRYGKGVAGLTTADDYACCLTGFFALLIACRRKTTSGEQAFGKALGILKEDERGDRLHDHLEKGMKIVKSDGGPRRVEKRLRRRVERVAPLLYAYYCSERQVSLREKFLMAVNADGDSALMGAMTGGLLGAGGVAIEGIGPWLDRLEEQALLVELADDLEQGFGMTMEWMKKYPDH